MSFDVAGEAYSAFMGRFSEPLAARFADATGPLPAGRVLDVGCGTGALTAVLVERLGPDRVSAVDPSPPLLASVRDRLPAVDVREARAEALPFPDGAFGAVLAQLVVHFLPDPVACLAEMRRVTAPGGLVGACVWDHAGRAGPLAVFWAAARALDPTVPDGSSMPGVREGHLPELFVTAGLDDVVAGSITVEVGHASFEDWWQPFTLGVGPAGAWVASLDDAGRAALRARCRTLLPEGGFTTRATAWTATGRA